MPARVVTDAPPTQTSAREVALAEGRIMRVAPGFEAATLRPLVTALEGRRSSAGPGSLGLHACPEYRLGILQLVEEAIGFVINGPG